MSVSAWTRRNIWFAVRKLAIWIQDVEPESCPTVTAGSGAPTASEPNGSQYYRTDGAAGTAKYRRISGAWVAEQDLGAAGVKADVLQESTSAAGVTIKVRNLTIGASTAAAGSTTSDAGVLPAATAPVYPTTAADGTKGVRIHASDKVTGRVIRVGNGAAAAVLKVYPPSGGTINGASADAAHSSASGKGVTLVCLDSTANTWLAW